jgi:hypothetical protein
MALRIIYLLNSELSPHESDILLPLLQIHLLLHALGLEIQHDEVSPAYIKTAQLISCHFRIIYVLEHYESGPTGILLIPQAHLTYRAVFTEDIIHFLVRNLEWKVANKEDTIHLRRKTFHTSKVCHCQRK